MMASIPNMRSTPLPVPAAKAAPASDGPAGEFAARLPGTPGQPDVPGAGPKPRPQVAQPPAIPADPALPDTAEAIKPGEDEGMLETKADAPQGERVPPVLLPFVHTAATPQVAPAGTAEETPPAEPATPGLAPVAGQPGRRTCGTDGESGKPGAAQPPMPEAADAETKAVDAAVKELLLHKLAAAKQPAEARGTAPSEAGQAEAVALQTQPANPASSKAAAPIERTPAGIAMPATAQAAAPPPAAELPQPALAPSVQATPVRAEAAGTADATRTTDLAVERQLDLARDSEWLDRLARDIARAGASDTPLRFKLHPQTLGHLMVELQQGDRGTAVRLTVETEAARQLLTDAQPRLAAEARAQGVRIAETHVDLSSFGRHAPGEQRRQDDARQTPQLRTARGPDTEAVASARSPRHAGLDRYA